MPGAIGGSGHKEGGIKFVITYEGNSYQQGEITEKTKDILQEFYQAPLSQEETLFRSQLKQHIEDVLKDNPKGF
ncbi:MAG: hypothetical protein Q7S27_05045 [Nanoarchaeota archaeon]|nr:hypothetical protein [Nanoarchaeota archaeon]